VPSSTEPGASAWLLLTAVLAVGSLLAWLLPAAALDWQPARAAAEPWRAWTGAFVHWSPLHLGANLAGAAGIGALGHAAKVPRRVTAAWFLAWPLTQAGLLLQPALAHYGGLSGVLHAGVAAVAVWLLAKSRGRRRAVGAALAAGLLGKLLLEAPWAGPLAHPAGWDIAVAPGAHLSGVLSGTACALLAVLVRRPRRA